MLEGARIAANASGRNGGFMASFLTHGVGNGAARFPEEMAELERLGIENFAETLRSLERLGIECELEPTGDLDVAVQPHELPWLAEEAEALREYGHEVELLDREQVRAQVHSPIYEGGLWRKSGAAIVNPAKLAWGLADAVERLGVRIHERTPVDRVHRLGAGLGLQAERQGRSRPPGAARDERLSRPRRGDPPAGHAGLGLRAGHRAAEPGPQRDAIGWRNRQGVGDIANQFHYYRLTRRRSDPLGRLRRDLRLRRADRRPARAARARASRCSRHTSSPRFPQLDGIRFTHRWGGAIDTCSRFFAFQGTALGGRLAYTVGHTGLGVGASRFGARVALDLLAGRETRRRGCARCDRSRALPPEPLRWAAVELTRNRLAAADRRTAAGAGSGCGRSTGSGSGSTADDAARHRRGDALVLPAAGARVRQLVAR